MFHYTQEEFSIFWLFMHKALQEEGFGSGQGLGYGGMAI